MDPFLDDRDFLYKGSGAHHQSSADEAEELLNRRESSLSGASSNDGHPTEVRVLGEPLSDRSSEPEGDHQPRPLVDAEGRPIPIEEQKEEDSLMDFEEQERKIAQQIAQQQIVSNGEEANDAEDGEQQEWDEAMQIIEEEDEDENGSEGKRGEEHTEEDDVLAEHDEDDEPPLQPLELRHDDEEAPLSSHSRISESLQNRQFSGAEVLLDQQPQPEESDDRDSAHESPEGYPLGYPTDPPPAYSSPPAATEQRPSTASVNNMLGVGGSKVPNGLASGYPVPTPRYATTASNGGESDDENDGSVDEKAVQQKPDNPSEAEEPGASSSSNTTIRQAIGSSFALAGGMAAAVASASVPPVMSAAARIGFELPSDFEIDEAPAKSSKSSTPRGNLDSPRGGGQRRLDSARVVQGARTVAELSRGALTSAARTRTAKGSRSAQETTADAQPRYPISTELKAMFRHIEEFVAERMDIQPSWRPFQIDYIPAVGDVDPFIKVPRPDDNDELLLGLAVLDEPAMQQSDSAIVDLRLHQMAGKSSGAADAPVKKLPRADRNAHQIDRWIQSVKELRRTKAPARVAYGKPMPSIEVLMQEWPTEVEQQLKGMKLLLNANLDADLEDYADLCLSLVDIPVHKSRLEALHVLFTLYAEFRASQHFRNLALDRAGAAERADTAPSTTIDQFILEESGGGTDLTS